MNVNVDGHTYQADSLVVTDVGVSIGFPPDPTTRVPPKAVLLLDGYHHIEVTP